MFCLQDYIASDSFPSLFVHLAKEKTPALVYFMLESIHIIKIKLNLNSVLPGFFGSPAIFTTFAHRVI